LIPFFTRWRERRILAKYPIAEPDWREALAQWAPARRLGAADQAQLRVLATFLLQEKTLQPVQGLALNNAMRVRLAILACLPILNLGLRWYRDWHEIIVYPDLFVPERTHVDVAGVVHRSHDILQGEAWEQGPVVLSWAAVAEARHPPGHNVVIHEMAHKLDMLNGACNGFPPLHRRMRRRAWTRAFESAYTELERLEQNGDPLPLDPYGLENPGEFFAVASEMFFEAPRHLRDFSPDLYAQLALFYRQQPVPA
jgi:Mlc titration factor MtfA (ptsG expression regulator)